MRALPQDLVHAHALATVAPTDLDVLYVSAAIATIKLPVNFLDFHEFFNISNSDPYIRQKYTFLRVNKTLQELGLDLPGFVWQECSETIGVYEHAYSYIIGNFNKTNFIVYCKEVDLLACRHYVLSEWKEIMSLLDDDEHMVIDAATDNIHGIIRLPPYKT